MTRIVCGWYTPDYSHWATALRRSLDIVGERHDIVLVEPMTGGWERNTLRKPEQILFAMERHPRDVVIFLDVDCLVHQPLDDLENIPCDVAVRFRHKRDVKPLSGTMVLHHNDRCRTFLSRWRQASLEAQVGTVDQQTLMPALFGTTGITVTNLEPRYCAVPGDGIDDPIIEHSNASADVRRVPFWMRKIHSLIRKPVSKERC